MQPKTRSNMKKGILNVKNVCLKGTFFIKHTIVLWEMWFGKKR